MPFNATRDTVLALLAAAALLALFAATPTLAVDYATDCPMIPSCVTCLQKDVNDNTSGYYCTVCDPGFTLNETADNVNRYCLCGVQYCNKCATDGSGHCATDGCASGTKYKNGACVADDSTASYASVVGAATMALVLMCAF